MKKLSKKIKKEIYAYLDEIIAYTSWYDKVEWVASEYDLSEEEAEGIVGDWAAGFSVDG